MPLLLLFAKPNHVGTSLEDAGFVVMDVGAVILPAAIGLFWPPKATILHVGVASVVIAIVGGMNALELNEPLLWGAGVRAGVFFTVYLVVALVARAIVERGRRSTQG